MDIEKLFTYLHSNKKLILYLFEHRDRVINKQEIDELATETILENLALYEIIELLEDKISLDYRVVVFLEEYIQSHDIIDIAIIGSILEELEHTILSADEFKNKQISLIPKIRRYIFKIDNILFKNLERLRIHINRVYKNTDEFKLKLKELKFYKQRLGQFQNTIESFEKFILKYTPLLQSFTNEDLYLILNFVKANKIELSRTLIPLTQDVISYINKLESKNDFVEKIVKLKELKDNYELNTKTDIQNINQTYELSNNHITISAQLDEQIMQDSKFQEILHKISKNKRLKTKIATSIDTSRQTLQSDEIFLNINLLHRQFISTKYSLIEFLIDNSSLQDKPFETICEVYCKMILIYEDEYFIKSTKISINHIDFAQVYHKDNNEFR